MFEVYHVVQKREAVESVNPGDAILIHESLLHILAVEFVGDGAILFTKNLWDVDQCDGVMFVTFEGVQQ